MMTSVAIENPALAYHEVVKSIQLPARLLFQARATGVHWKTETKKAANM